MKNSKTKLIKTNHEDMNKLLLQHELIKREQVCADNCQSNMKHIKVNSYKDGSIWRCYSPGYSDYKVRKSLKVASFSSNFEKNVTNMLKSLFKWGYSEKKYKILKSIDSSRPTLQKI